MMMFVDCLRAALPRYKVEAVIEERLADVLELFLSNTEYFSLTQSHSPSLEECREDMTALPPDVGLERKSFLALYDGDRCVAVIDLIADWPEKKTGFLGFFILNADQRGRGLGRAILDSVFRAARAEGFTKMALVCYAVNEAGRAFWLGQGFREEKRTRRETDGKEYEMLHMAREL